MASISACGLPDFTRIKSLEVAPSQVKIPKGYSYGTQRCPEMAFGCLLMSGVKA